MLLRHNCISSFCKLYPKAFQLQSAPFGIAIDMRSGKGIAVSRDKVYDFKLDSIFKPGKILEFGEDNAEIYTFLKWGLPELSCYAIGVKKTKDSHSVKIFLSKNSLMSYEILGYIQKSFH